MNVFSCSITTPESCYLFWSIWIYLSIISAIWFPPGTSPNTRGWPQQKSLHLSLSIHLPLTSSIPSLSISNSHACTPSSYPSILQLDFLSEDPQFHAHILPSQTLHLNVFLFTHSTTPHRFTSLNFTSIWIEFCINPIFNYFIKTLLASIF